MVKKKNTAPHKKNKPQLSIYIPTYNRPKLLKNALSHILEVQKGGIDIELLIYDSSTNDDSREIVKEFYADHADKFETRYVHKNYEHVGWKIVEAYRDAAGEYVTYLGDDDYFNIENLKEALQKLKHQPQIHGWFATWQLWDDENKRIVNKTNEHGLNWMTSEPKTYGMDTVLLLANEVINRVVCPEIFIIKTETARKVMMDWRYPDEQLALFVLFRTLRFGKVHVTNTPFYRYCEVRQTALLDQDKDSQTHYGERLYKEAPFMTRFSREWFVSQAFREAGHDHIPLETQQAILQSVNFEYIQRLKGNGLAAAVRHKEYQLAHRYISTMASWNKDIYSKEELYHFEKVYLVAYALQTIEKQIDNIEENKNLQLFGFGDNDVTQYFKQNLGNPNVSATMIQDHKDLSNDSPILVPLPKHRKKLTEKYGFAENKVIALEDVMNTLRMIRDHISCENFTSSECSL
jgi:glycosyltransferase involved in cell wall biosynthesis